MKRLALCCLLLAGCPTDREDRIKSSTSPIAIVSWQYVDPMPWVRAPGFRRTKTPTGWLVLTNGGRPVFVPDPKHEWNPAK